ncbi:hypothetical protein PENTCL1PPCAC_8417, partial [Pristionchus entomophagus]
QIIYAIFAAVCAHVFVVMLSKALPAPDMPGNIGPRSRFGRSDYFDSRNYVRNHESRSSRDDPVPSFSTYEYLYADRSRMTWHVICLCGFVIQTVFLIVIRLLQGEQG